MNDYASLGCIFWIYFEILTMFAYLIFLNLFYLNTVPWNSCVSLISERDIRDFKQCQHYLKGWPCRFWILSILVRIILMTFLRCSDWEIWGLFWTCSSLGLKSNLLALAWLSWRHFQLVGLCVKKRHHFILTCLPVVFNKCLVESYSI